MSNYRENDNNRSIIVPILIMAVIVTVIMGLINMCCGGSFFDVFDIDDSPWEPRHTQVDKGELKEVNTFILPSSRA